MTRISLALFTFAIWMSPTYAGQELVDAVDYLHKARTSPRVNSDSLNEAVITVMAETREEVSGLQQLHHSWVIEDDAELAEQIREYRRLPGYQIGAAEGARASEELQALVEERRRTQSLLEADLRNIESRTNRGLSVSRVEELFEITLQNGVPVVVITSVLSARWGERCIAEPELHIEGSAGEHGDRPEHLVLQSTSVGWSRLFESPSGSSAGSFSIEWKELGPDAETPTLSIVPIECVPGAEFEISVKTTRRRHRVARTFYVIPTDFGELSLEGGARAEFREMRSINEASIDAYEIALTKPDDELTTVSFTRLPGKGQRGVSWHVSSEDRLVVEIRDPIQENKAFSLSYSPQYERLTPSVSSEFRFGREEQ